MAASSIRHSRRRRALSGDRGKRRRGALVWALTLLAGCLGMQAAPRAVAAVPAAEDIVRRVVAAQAAAAVSSADVQLRLRIHKNPTDPPDCVFNGTLRVEQGRQIVQVQPQSAGVACTLVNRYALGRLFEASEPLESFLARFDFSVLGEKLVDAAHWYLVQGTSRDPQGNPHRLTLWIDDARGVVPQGTISYAWGDIDTQQTYTRLNHAWILTRQLLAARRFDASLELEYRNFVVAR